ncbi:MAG: ABC transporter substrate-binding protein [Desertimonas sp.]
MIPTSRATRARTRPRRWRTATALVAAAIASTAVAGGGDVAGSTGSAAAVSPARAVAGAEAVEGGTLRVAHGTPPSTLDPASGNSGYDHIYLYPMFDTLIRFTPDTMEPAPGLASSWEFTDETTLVLTLQEGVTFHDGTPFDAEAVKYNFERSMTWEGSNIAGDLQSVDSVEVVDDLTVQVNLKNADTALPLILADRAGMMVSPTAAEELGEDFSLSPVGAGPFVFREWRIGERVVMDRYEDYWGEAPTLETIDFTIIVDNDTAMNAILAGQQDFIFNVEPSDLGRVEGNDSLTTSVSDRLFHYEFYVNLGRPPFDDVRVRQAFNLAIDRATLVQATAEGEGQIAMTPLPPGHWAYSDQFDDAYPYDPERARELLAEAGYEDGLTFEVVGWTTDIDVRRAEVIQAMLSEVGMQMDIRTTEVPQATAQFFDEKRYDAYLAAWTGRPDPTLTYTLLFSKDGYFNTAGVETPGLEELLIESRSVDGLEERATAFAELTQVVVDEALYVPLNFPPDIAVMSNRVVNYVPNLLGKPQLAYVGFSD